ncbi:MAG: substrate-binding domain-containing protein [Eubacteriales bacterium]|nr:substrate-binding domain-containing protein [Eubacteriales bacterium]
MSFDTFVLERWIRDRDVFVSTAADLGAEVNVQNANGDVDEQVAQIEYLIDKGVDALVIIAIDGQNEALHHAIERARERGIYIIAYDRSIDSANVDLLVSFDNVRVGELMAEAVISQIPKGGKIAALCGSPSDDNVAQVEKGIDQVLARHNAKLVYKNYADNWKDEYAYTQMNECLDQIGTVDGVICGNDALAAMAFKALSERQMANDVCLVGQDADIDACQRIVEGTQYMTVYKSIDNLARLAAEYAMRLIQDEPLELTTFYNDGIYDVPYLKLEPVAVTTENIDEEIIDSRFHLRNEVYLNVDLASQRKTFSAS